MRVWIVPLKICTRQRSSCSLAAAPRHFGSVGMAISMGGNVVKGQLTASIFGRADYEHHAVSEDREAPNLDNPSRSTYLIFFKG